MLTLKSISPAIALLYRLVEVGAIAFTGYYSLFIPFEGGIPPNRLYWLVISGACVLYGLMSSALYRSWRGTAALEAIIGISKAWSSVLLVLFIVIIFTQTGTSFSRYWIAAWSISTWVLLTLIRLFFAFLFQKLRQKGFNARHIAIIGDGGLANNLASQIALNTWSGYVLRMQLPATDLMAIEQIDSWSLDEIWIAMPIDQSNQLQNVLGALKHCPLVIKFVPDLFMFRLINLSVTEVLGTPMLNLTSTPFVGLNLFVKTLEDLILSSLILILMSPVLILLAIGVKLTSPGPIFYRQQRMGLNGRSFMMLKFRSMPADTETSGAVWGGSEAKVIHPFSAWIRKYNLDELPQFLNVLMGQMSIVGPRPERTEFINQFQAEIPDYMKKHIVKAGITGWAQVHGLRGDTDIKKRIEYDLFYIEDWSLGLDLKIIAMTIIQTVIPIKHPTAS